MDLQGYRRVPWRVWLCRLGALLSFGLLLIVFHWWPRLGVLARCCSCSLALADFVLIKDSHGQKHVVEVLTEEMEEGSLDEFLLQWEEDEWRETVHLQQEERTMLCYFLFEGLRYIWLDRREDFCPASVLTEEWTCRALFDFQRGLSHQEQSSRRRLFGDNIIDVPLKSYMRLLIEEILNPFYVFQVLSLVLWMNDDYYYYAGCIFFISVFSIIFSLYEARKQRKTIRDMANSVTEVKIRRESGEEESVSSEKLVPGDCLIIPEEGLVLPCDAALLVGECLVDESMLTGESISVLKTPLPDGDSIYSSKTALRHTLFCGTHIIQAKGGNAVAVVTSTGFFTAKGKLISSILYSQEMDFRFYKDAMKFLLILGVIALSGTIYIFVTLLKADVTRKELVIRSLDIITIVVPPALPAAITIGTIYAQNRLKKCDIFCICPPKINACGKVSVFCFDKTGTLTEEGLDVWGVMTTGPAGFSQLVTDPTLLPEGNMSIALACCHTITLLEGQPIGDPLELTMMEYTGWTLQEPAGKDDAIHSEFGGHTVLAVMRPPTDQPNLSACSRSGAVAIVKRFPFSSALQRTSVLTVDFGGHSALALIKGSPEMVASLCQPDTVPENFFITLQRFSREGLRVLALACKPVDIYSDLKNAERAEVEKEMQFLGLLMMKNVVKPESTEAITILRLADIRSIMVTGDNILTAVSVAKTCGMVKTDEKVIFVHATCQTDETLPTLRFSLEEDGASAAQSPRDINEAGSDYNLAIDGKSFAALCDHFPEQLPKVLMKATIFAMMLPDQKAQLVKELKNLKEGRCSLVTSFSLFRYMALYSLIQFCSVLILNTVKTTLGDFQFLFFDLVLVTLLAMAMGGGGPSEELQSSRPPATLLALPVFGSLFIHTCMIVLGQLGAFFITTSQGWYIPLNSTVFGTDNLPNMENNSVFDLSGFQYIFFAAVVTKGYPHKKPLYRNWKFVCLLLIQSAVMVWLVVHPVPWFSQILQLYDFPDLTFRLLLIGVAVVNFLICILTEMLIDCGMLNFLRLLRGNRPSKKQYKRLRAALSRCTTWPPLDQTLNPSDNSIIPLS
ncbi:PREDICTED: probable cation-transporting ATPase 13A2 [Cyprinodon variegatus]|uniref:probable cation-transporting ATPase 13A2 n=1 Tax=Cyprinodon variegatus TaxID=28743 RepID=UPI00074277D1|nr:PREDICTED: probable cation-transporting ATPase 13A2 [Cyprinodon variegatus]